MCLLYKCLFCVLKSRIINLYSSKKDIIFKFLLLALTSYNLVSVRCILISLVSWISPPPHNYNKRRFFYCHMHILIAFKLKYVVSSLFLDYINNCKRKIYSQTNISHRFIKHSMQVMDVYYDGFKYNKSKNSESTFIQTSKKIATKFIKPCEYYFRTINVVVLHISCLRNA